MYHFLCRAIVLNEGKFRGKEIHAMKNSTGWTPCGLAGQVLRLAARGPYGAAGLYGRSVAGRALHWFSLGRGGRRLLLAAGQHANEWITTPLLMRFAGELAGGVWPGVTDELKLWFAPLVNPDGAALVTGALDSGPLYENARRIAGRYPDIAFPAGWKANIAGVDLNLQFPAGWQEARRIKFAQGWTGPAPRDYVGRAPLCAPESRALYRFTKRTAPDMVISLHTQGEVIYWKYLDIEPPGALECGRAMAEASGYALEDTPYASGHAGFKDWFILARDRPGYTIECGLGENPLPWSGFDAIYEKLRPALAAALGCC